MNRPVDVRNEYDDNDDDTKPLLVADAIDEDERSATRAGVKA
jgi:hypothetical protein